MVENQSAPILNLVVLLFYKYVHIKNVDGIVEWQQKICSENQITGKIRLSDEGINGTVCGNPESVKIYINKTKENSLFDDVDFKESTSTFDPFDEQLSVKKVREIITIRDAIHDKKVGQKKNQKVNSSKNDVDDGIKEIQNDLKEEEVVSLREKMVHAEHGVHLKPEDFHKAVEECEKRDDYCLIDVRNNYGLFLSKFIFTTKFLVVFT